VCYLTVNFRTDAADGPTGKVPLFEGRRQAQGLPPIGTKADSGRTYLLLAGYLPFAGSGTFSRHGSLSRIRPIRDGWNVPRAEVAIQMEKRPGGGSRNCPFSRRDSALVSIITFIDGWYLTSRQEDKW
jgi:hypothetical protein